MENSSTRILALDVGDARIGVAVSDETRLIARSLAIVKRRAGQPAQHVAELARQQEATVVVVGLPRNMNGTLGPQARKVQNFAEQLRQIAPQLQLVFWDERLSTCEAREILLERGASKKQRRQPVDAVAAAVILQSYLDSQRTHPAS